jgi:tetratricopeptide (TPR) repeat protein/TolB-like protein/DNA-binding winged helix-turn-helix (wHTH) protein
VDSDLLHGFYLNNLLVEPLRGQVQGPDGPVHLPPKAMEALLCLASKPTRLVTREALIEKVWGAGQGSTEALGRAIGDIRHALGDQPDHPRFIQTLPRRGYRLIVEPAPTTRPAADGTDSGAGTPPEDGFIEDLKQRGVVQAAIAYVVVGWLIIQVADTLLGLLNLPARAGTYVAALVIAGFPVVLVLAWFLEIRDGRVVLDKGSRRAKRRRQFSRTYLSVIGAFAIAAAGVYVYDSKVGLPRFADPAPTPAADAGEASLPPVEDNSIAVLPFLNLDGSEETQIFANGLVDDVITRLSRVPGLLVSSRGDAYTLEPNSASSEVRGRLRVARYLEGSVQMSGDRMRIIVQLIDSETGFHMLSRSFDRLREDFFDIRDEITELTVANVRVALPPETQTAANALGEDPSLDVYVLYRRGVESALLPPSVENLETALGWYDAALEQDPQYAAALAGKCWAFVDLYPETDDAKYIDAAEQACGRALQLNPNLDIVHTALGELYLATGRHERAEESFGAALTIDPNSVAALTGLGNVARLQQHPEEAEKWLRQAIGLHPGDWSAYNSLGFFLYRSGRYGEAAGEYKYVVALAPDNIMGWTNLAAAHMLDGDFESALRAYQRLLELGASQSTYSNMGLMYYYLDLPDEAIEAMRQSVELAPNDHLAWSNLGDVLGLGGRQSEAREAFETAERLARAALEVNPSDAPVVMDMAWIRAMLDKPRDARELIGRAQSLSPDDPYVYYYSGLIHARAGQTKPALDDFEAALEHGYPLKMLAQDPQLISLRDDERFRRLVATDSDR